METTYESKYHKHEENNWWFKARRDIILKLLKNTDKNSKILDIGCSGGVFIEFMKSRGFKNMQGIDISKKAIDLCKKRGLDNVFVMDAIDTDFDDGEFDVIIASDILEHIKDDNKALIEWNRILKYDGRLIIFVPAFNFLWSSLDEKNKHHKRYTKSMLIKMLETTNFKIDRSSYWNLSSFFPKIVTNIFSKKDKIVYLEINPVTNKLFAKIMGLENKILKWFNFPIGVSLFIVGTKND